MKCFLGNIFVGFLALYLATVLVPGVYVEGSFETQLKILFFAGAALGLVNFFIKPIINVITFPLRLITFGLFSLVVNMGMVWLVDILFPELTIETLGALFWTGVLVWLLSLFFIRKKRAKIQAATK